LPGNKSYARPKAIFHRKVLGFQSNATVKTLETKIFAFVYAGYFTTNAKNEKKNRDYRGKTRKHPA